MENIKLENVSFAYDDEKILDDINLTLFENKFNTLLGPSGCGKTTILRLVAGFLTPQQGKILIGEKDITNFLPEKRNISTVFQNYALFQNMSVKQNVAYGLKVRKVPKDVIEQKCAEYLSLVRMEQYADKGIDELSGGQQQRVAIARALATEPKMLLMDEPMSNLDAALRVQMREEIREIQQKIGITTLFITHDQEEALAISDYIAVMSKGKVLQHGSPQEIYFHPVNNQVAHAVGMTNNLTARQSQALKPLFGKEVTDLRPESMMLSKEKCADNMVNGVIEKVQFCGAHTEYLVTVEDGSLKIIEPNHWDGSNIKQCGEHVFVGCR